MTGAVPLGIEGALDQERTDVAPWTTTRPFWPRARTQFQPRRPPARFAGKARVVRAACHFSWFNATL